MAKSGYVIVYKKNNKRVPGTPFVSYAEQARKFIVKRLGNSKYLTIRKITKVK